MITVREVSGCKMLHLHTKSEGINPKKQMLLLHCNPCYKSISISNCLLQLLSDKLPLKCIYNYALIIQGSVFIILNNTESFDVIIQTTHFDFKLRLIYSKKQELAFFKNRYCCISIVTLNYFTSSFL